MSACGQTQSFVREYSYDGSWRNVSFGTFVERVDELLRCEIVGVLPGREGAFPALAMPSRAEGLHLLSTTLRKAVGQARLKLVSPSFSENLDRSVTHHDPQCPWGIERHYCGSANSKNKCHLGTMIYTNFESNWCPYLGYLHTACL